ncbi:MAG: precorrin-6A reductase [Actinomycetota bacterium]|nr:precorrin-6A reductase [Actinomycetota bacterium]
MILLLGGTSESLPIVKALIARDFEVLLSTATAYPLAGLESIQIERRAGSLDIGGFEDLIVSRGITALIDATHPYAAEVSLSAALVCRKMGTPYLAFERPSDLLGVTGLTWVADHTEAASLATSLGKAILLTIGTKNLGHYVKLAETYRIRLMARVLDNPVSLSEALSFGLKREEITLRTGPFTFEDNLEMIAECGADVLVTKDSGKAGGTRPKALAALSLDCKVIVVERPKRFSGAFHSIVDLLGALDEYVK